MSAEIFSAHRSILKNYLSLHAALRISVTAAAEEPNPRQPHAREGCRELIELTAHPEGVSNASPGGGLRCTAPCHRHRPTQEDGASPTPARTSAASSQEGRFADGCNRTQETSIHPCRAESTQDRVRRLLEAQRSPLVLTHHSEAFWGNAGLGKSQPFSLAANSSLARKWSVKAEKPTALPNQPYGRRSHHTGSTSLGYCRLGAWIWPPSARCSSMRWKPSSL